MTPSILIASPISNRAWCLNDFLASLLKQDYPSGQLHLYFLLNDSGDDSLDILTRFSEKFHGRFASVICDGIAVKPLPNKDHSWSPERLDRMILLRNNLFDVAAHSGADYLFSIDSDVILENPGHLRHLVDGGHQIISPVFWAQWEKQNEFPLPNVWKQGQYEIPYPFVEKLRWIKADMPVGGLGACTLIHKEVWQKGVTYDPVYNVPSEYWGEDRNFCLRAAVQGFKLMACTCFPVKHLDRPESPIPK